MVAVLLAFRFVLELCLLTSAAFVGLSLSGGDALGILGSIALVAVVCVIWGLLVAPRRRVDLPLGARVAIELALFVVAGVGLAVVGHPYAGLTLVAAECLLLPLLIAVGHPPGRLRRSEPDAL